MFAIWRKRLDLGDDSKLQLILDKLLMRTGDNVLFIADVFCKGRCVTGRIRMMLPLKSISLSLTVAHGLQSSSQGGWKHELVKYLEYLDPNVTKDTDTVEWWSVSRDTVYVAKRHRD